MNIKALEYVIAVIDYGTMSRAAEKMFTSQPNVSRTIRELERQLGVKIFSRGAKKITLTPEGEVFEFHARRILNETREMVERFSGKGIAYKVGSTVTVGHYLLNDYVSHIKRSVPNATFQLTITNTRDIETALLNNNLDFAFVEGVIRSKNVIEYDIEKDELIVVVGASFVFDKKIEYLKDLHQLPWIRRESGSGDRNQFEQTLREQNIEPRVVYQSSNLELIVQAVSNNYGFAILSRRAATTQIELGNIVEVRLKDFKCERTIRFVIRKEDRNNHNVMNVLNAIREQGN